MKSDLIDKKALIEALENWCGKQRYLIPEEVWEIIQAAPVEFNKGNVLTRMNDEKFERIQINYVSHEEKMSNRTWDSTIGDGGEYIETPEKMNDFFDDIEKVYEKYGLSIEGSHAGFAIRKYNEKDMKNLRAAVKHYTGD